MTDPPTEPDSAGSRALPRALSILASASGAWMTFAVLLVLRVLAGRFAYFFEQDEMSIAAGVAALLDRNPGYLYHYGPQVGYYRGVQALVLLLGGATETIPHVMTGLSTLAGAALPVFVLRSFRDVTTPRQRVLAAAIVTCLPVLWVSAQYGNTAVVSAALVAGSVALLSNGPGPAGVVVAFAVYGAAGLVRADAVLVAPLILWLTVRAARSDARVFKAAAAALGGGGLAGVALLLFDPGVTTVVDDVRSHATDPQLVTRFWEHLTWAISPLVLGFGIWGWARLTQERSSLRWVLLLWVFPVLGFYFASTTTPRYFLLVTPPAALLAALGMEQAAVLGRRSAVAWSVVLALGFAHLVVGLGRFPSSRPAQAFLAPEYPTHDGGMPTGALIFQAYHGRVGLFGHSIRRGGGWGDWSHTAVGMRLQLQRVVDTPPPSRVFAVIDGWDAHVIHYHVREFGGRLLERSAGHEWLAPHRYQLGSTEFVVLGIKEIGLDVLAAQSFGPGDEIWHLVSGDDPFEWSEIEAVFPHLVAEADGSTLTNSARVYRLRSP